MLRILLALARFPLSLSFPSFLVPWERREVKWGDDVPFLPRDVIKQKTTFSLPPPPSSFRHFPKSPLLYGVGTALPLALPSLSDKVKEEEEKEGTRKRFLKGKEEP